MEDIKTLAFNCLNPECGKLIKFKRPAKTGVYEVKCPYCQVTKRLKLNGLDSVQGSGESSAPDVASNGGGHPDNSDKDEIELTGPFFVGTEYKITCPHCRTQVFGFKTDKAGARSVPCPACKGKTKFEVILKTEIFTGTDSLQPFHGKLTHLRRGWVNKSYPLYDGCNIIGRYDENEPSDIAIKNDSTMSRRSVQIDVKNGDHGIGFMLKVLRAANPITHNGAELTEGDCISLNFGDILIMGKTKFRFEKDI